MEKWCGKRLENQVLQSRESEEYFRTAQAAEAALKSGDWTQRSEPKDQTIGCSPGPWHVGGNGTIVYDENGIPVANATVYHGRSDPDMAKANARVIAAAPALLKSLTWAAGMAEEAILAREEGDDPQDCPDIIAMHRQSLREALAVIQSAVSGNSTSMPD